ncbi:MAG: hypothetical protein MJZ38_04965 [archaeon]|nr:hypothetical protein [archaeon]
MAPIPTEEILREAFSGLSVHNVTSDVPTEVLVLEGGDLGAIASFSREAGGSHVFIERMPLDLGRILIREEHYGDLPLPILGGVQLDSHIFNRDINALDLDRPVEMRIYTLYQGKAFGVHLVNEELDTLRRLTPEERVAGFAEARRQKLKDNIGMAPRKEDPRHERLSEILVADRQYRALKTDADRCNHVMKIARRPGNDQLRRSIMKEDGSGFSMEQIRKVVAIVNRKTDLSTPVHTQMTFEERPR